MYAFVDRPVKDLDRASRLLVWAMRSWVQSMADRRCPGHTLAPAFAGQAMLSGLQPFMQMMALINRHALDNVQFRTPQCGYVGEHEAVILAMVGKARDRSPGTVSDTLALLVEEDAVGPILDAMVRMGAALDCARG